MNKVSLIIVHWNTPVLLRKQLEKLFTKKSILSIEVIIVDNASEESLSWVKKEFPQVKFIENKLNVGYATACNQGAAHAKGEWFLFLNPDVEITPDSINRLIKSAEENGFDACSPKSSSMGYQKPLPTPLSLLVEFTPLHRLIPLEVFKKKTLFGGCLLIKKKVFEELGGWDEDFFLWFEDSDLTAILLKNNYRIGFIDMQINHAGGVTFKKLDDKYQKQIFFNSMDIFAKKHFSLFGKLVVTIIRKRYV